MRTIFLSSRPCAALAAGILLNLGHADAGITINAASPKLTDVQSAVSRANAGDTVIVPAGTAAWSSTLIINKGITLIGQTTTDSVAGTAVDNTIIQDNVPRGAGGGRLISAGNGARISGFTFAPLITVGNQQGLISLGGNSVRLDHCHFQNLPYTANYVQLYDCTGVADHNVLEFTGGTMESFHFANAAPDGNGDASFATPPNYGSGQFFFIEDNYMNNTSSYQLLGNTDDWFGARWVFRHNHCYEISIQTHGTEGGRDRGGRAREIYNNDFHYRMSHPTGGVRTGSILVHDNSYYGAQPTRGIIFEAYRVQFRFGGGPWKGASGDNPWDVNDTEGNGSCVPGHSPYLYASGTVTSGSTSTLVDTAKNWTPNQWANFTAKRLSDSQIGLILSNTSNTLTVTYLTGIGSGGATWAAGNQYQIHKCLVVLDQPGRAQGDLITGGDTAPIDSTTGTVTWPHQILEPSYSWNDAYISSTGTKTSVDFATAYTPTVQSGRDFYNLGVGASDAAVRAAYVAALNGQNYTGPYIYPHPLVSGGAGPSPSATPAAPTNLRVIGP